MAVSNEQLIRLYKQYLLAEPTEHFFLGLQQGYKLEQEGSPEGISLLWQDLTMIFSHTGEIPDRVANNVGNFFTRFEVNLTIDHDNKVCTIRVTEKPQKTTQEAPKPQQEELFSKKS